MSVINMLSPWQWALLAAVPPAILLLYFLKLKRLPLAVPSTYLWHKSIEDLHVNSIWQRLRTSILLLLQLLLIAIAMAAVVRPGWRGTQLIGERFVFLIDTSASMSATDVKPTRLDEAKRRVADLIDQMASGDVAMLVTFCDVADVPQSFTDNKRDLRRKLDAIQPTNRSTSLGEALRVAAGLANPGRSLEVSETQVAEGQPATLYIFSDGKFPDVVGFALGNLTPKFVPIGEPEVANVAITAFNTRRRDDHKEQLQAFARLQNFGDEKVTAEVELFRDDSLLDASQVELKPHGSGGVVFELGDLHSGVLRLHAGSGGALALDDDAWVAVDPPTRSKVLVVTAGNNALETALRTTSAQEIAEIDISAPAILETKEYDDRAASGYYALVIYDSCTPKQMPQADTLFIGRLPVGSSWTAGDKTVAPQIIDIDTAHPLMQLIDLSNVKFAEAQSFKPPAGSIVLIDTDAGPLLSIGPREGFEDAVLGAEIFGVDENGQRVANTDWPLRLSFPVFVFNALTYFGGAEGSVAVANTRPGHTVALRASGSSDTLTVKTPKGKSFPLERERSGAFSFSATDDLGAYEVEESGQRPQRFTVNLFDEAESDLKPRPENTIRIGYVDVQGESHWEGARREMWKFLVFVALGVLCLEWYIYNRRVYL